MSPKVDGWTITWESREQCAEDSTKKYSVVLEGECKKNGGDDTTGKFTDTTKSGDTCKSTAKYSGKHACVTASIPISRYMAKIAPFVGFILIFFGLVMVFKGQFFLHKVVGILVGLVSAVIIFGCGYGLMPNDVAPGVLIGVLILSIILGGVISYFSYKFTFKWAGAILSGIGGVVAVGLIVKVAGLKGAIGPILCFLGCILGIYLGNKYKTFINSSCTSMIGAFMIVRGIGCYAPGYPNETGMASQAAAGDLNFKNEVYFYFGGFLVIFIFGFIWQMRDARLHIESDSYKNMENGEGFDAFEGQEESRKCGCF